MNSSKSRVVFLLGAGRSGTTLLYKILSLHNSVAYLSNYQNRYPRWPVLAYLHRALNQFPELKRKSWFKEQGNAYFNERREWLHSMVPTPSEAEPVYASCDMPLTPTVDYTVPDHVMDCLRNCFESVRQASKGQVLLTKRTANNRRIPILNQIFPDAKYIHLIRDGRAVAYSSLRVSWWDDHTLFWAGKTPKQMVASGHNPLELAARNWVESMRSLDQGISGLPAKQVLEVRYEHLLQDWRGQIQRILDFMDLGSQNDGMFWDTIESLNLAPKQEVWMHNWTQAELELVHDIER